VNPGGEPERDDTGLPPVDIVIPDDARELDRDVQAYYRELRAQRRHERRHRLHRTITRDGIILPLLACCLILALITGTLLTVFTATSDQNGPGVPGRVNPTTGAHPSSGHSAGSSGSKSGANPHASSGSTNGSPGASTGVKSATRAKATTGSKPASARPAVAAAPSPDIVYGAAPLPDIALAVDGISTAVSLPTLSGTLLVLVPPACRCAAALAWLTAIGVNAGAPTFLIGTPQTIREVRWMYSRLPASAQAGSAVATDSRGVLEADYPFDGLTAILVGANSSSVAYATQLSQLDAGGLLRHALLS
jgi:hypothetical protein